MVGSQHTENEETASPRAGAATIVVFVVLAGLLVAQARLLPLFDDEANMVLAAARPASEILAHVFEPGGLEHPPLTELMLHAWLPVAGHRSLWLLRLPSVLLWLAALVALLWSVAPVTSRRQRLAIVTAVGLWPIHLTFPVAAGWYALQAALGCAGLGFFLRDCDSGRPASAWHTAGWVLCGALMAYATHAWPGLVAGWLIVAMVLGHRPGMAAGRGRFFIGWVTLFALAAPVAVSALRVSSAALSAWSLSRSDRALGAAVALFAGESAPANLIVLGVLATATAAAVAVILWWSRSRLALALVLGGMAPLALLLFANALSDKRLILGTPLLLAGLGCALESLHGRSRGASVALVAAALVLIAQLPAWSGLAEVSDHAWAFARWQDPIDEVTAYHIAAPQPRVLAAINPALLLAAARWQGTPLVAAGGAVTSASPLLRVRPAARPAQLADAFDTRRIGLSTSRSLTVDLVVQAGEGRLVRLANDTLTRLESKGWRQGSQRVFGFDPLASSRHGSPASASRYLLIRLTAGGLGAQPL